MHSIHTYQRLAISAVMAFAFLPAIAATAEDPLAGDTWHAMGGTWPGTLKFDGEKKTVVLEPLGATALEATYEVKVTDHKKNLGPAIPEWSGELTMKSLDGRTSDAKFVRKGKDLVLTYKGGVSQPDTYKRMTAAEQQAAVADLQKRIERGEVKLPAVQ